jgi:hypothetical protein
METISRECLSPLLNLLAKSTSLQAKSRVAQLLASLSHHVLGAVFSRISV